MDRALQSILTGSTCGFACWQANEEVCRCSCGGANHGILRLGGVQPQRTAKIDGQFYELVGIMSSEGHDCAASFFHAVDEERSSIEQERFPGLDRWAYGEYREYRTLPILDRKLTATQERWPEVQAVKGARRLIWARPAGSEYATRSVPMAQSC